MQPLNMIQRKDPNPFKTKLILESSKKNKNKRPQMPAPESRDAWSEDMFFFTLPFVTLR